MINKEKNEEIFEINALDFCMAVIMLIETGDDIFFNDIWHSKRKLR